MARRGRDPAARARSRAHTSVGSDDLFFEAPPDPPVTLGRNWGQIKHPASGLGAAGGYVGKGVGTTNLAGRTLRDLILGRDTTLTRHPFRSATFTDVTIRSARRPAVKTLLHELVALA
jgi:hypothetical protein